MGIFFCFLDVYVGILFCFFGIQGEILFCFLYAYAGNFLNFARDVFPLLIYFYDYLTDGIHRSPGVRSARFKLGCSGLAAAAGLAWPPGSVRIRFKALLPGARRQAVSGGGRQGKRSSSPLGRRKRRSPFAGEGYGFDPPKAALKNEAQNKAAVR